MTLGVPIVLHMGDVGLDRPFHDATHLEVGPAQPYLSLLRFGPNSLHIGPRPLRCVSLRTVAPELGPGLKTLGDRV